MTDRAQRGWRKRTAAILTILLMAGCNMIPVTGEQTGATATPVVVVPLSDRACVNGNVALIREGPAIANDQIGQLVNGNVVPVKGRSENGIWLLVEFGKQGEPPRNGWVLAEGMVLETDPAGATGRCLAAFPNASAATALPTASGTALVTGSPTADLTGSVTVTITGSVTATGTLTLTITPTLTETPTITPTRRPYVPPTATAESGGDDDEPRPRDPTPTGTEAPVIHPTDTDEPIVYPTATDPVVVHPTDTDVPPGGGVTVEPPGEVTEEPPVRETEAPPEATSGAPEEPPPPEVTDPPPPPPPEEPDPPPPPPEETSEPLVEETPVP